MSKVEQIEKQIAKLSRPQVRRLARWLAKFDAALWDEQIERDSETGRLDFLFAEADAERRRGTLREWPRPRR